MKNRKGISLIVLIITIIVVIILAATVILTLSRDGGIINKARYAKDEYNKIEYKDRINEAYTIVKNKQEMQGKTDREIFEEVKKSLNFDKAKYEISDKLMNITTKEGYEYTLTGEGKVYDEKVVILDIAEGNIDLYSNGYKQYTGNLQNLNKNGATEYTGKYIIEGTTTENVIRVCDEGTYNIIIKNLNINTSNCSLNANAGNKATGCNVTLTIEGENSLISSGCGLGFANATPNVDGVENGSKLVIEGNGSLYAEGGNYMAGIGSGHGTPRGTASNIIINSGKITAHSKMNAPGIGGGLHCNANNIIINGGEIYARYGIGCWSGSGTVRINGGKITSLGESGKSAIGNGFKQVIITGGTINATSTRFTGISCSESGSIKITGGNILARGKDYNMGISTTATLVGEYTPTNGTNNIYETSIKLNNVGEGIKITSITSSDNIEYGVKDMYTLEDGMLYLYLPEGTREITIKVNGKTYKGTVGTNETDNYNVLSE